MKIPRRRAGGLPGGGPTNNTKTAAFWAATNPKLFAENMVFPLAHTRQNTTTVDPEKVCSAPECVLYTSPSAPQAPRPGWPQAGTLRNRSWGADLKPSILAPKSSKTMEDFGDLDDFDGFL